MSTPTPMKHAPSQQGRTPSQQGRTPSQLPGATPPVSTPFSNPAHTAFSPLGPRSSPQQVKKSPANSSTLQGQSQNGALNFDSPSTAAAMRALDIGSGFDLGLDNVGVGGIDGLGAFSGDDDKVKRFDAILKTLDKKGLVSEAGLSRLAQKLGLELLCEDQTAPNGRKTRNLVIAGSALALDIVLDNNIVQNVALTFHESPPSVARHADAANQILLKDLQLLPQQSPLTKTLDQFATNFERLVSLDKLSISPGLDCHEALAGIYVSLERLYGWDLAKVREDPNMSGKSDQYLSQMVMCARHGYPVMHAQDRVGLALQYWKELRFFPPAGDAIASFAQTQEKIWSLRVGCAPIEGIGLPPVRVSENWVSKDIVKADETMGPKVPVLDWQEPENVSLPQSEDNKDAGMELLQPDLSTARVPRVMFTVAFDPPVILPQTDWMRLYTYANVEAPNINPTEFSLRGPPTFDSLFFPIPPATKQDPSELRTVSCRREVRIFDKDRTPSVRLHRNSLFIYKPVYSQEISEMPFSHPQQLINMLPLLRQYAFLSILLENSFRSKTQSATASPAGAETKDTRTPVPGTTTRDELADFMGTGSDKATSPGASDDELNMDVILWVHPLPHLQVVFPLRESTVNITIQILEGGTVLVSNENILPKTPIEDSKAGGKLLGRDDLAKALEHLEDLCKWAEWIRARF